MNCKVCGSNAVESITALPFEFPGTVPLRVTETPVCRCAGCGCYWRVFAEPIQSATHFEGHTYNDPAREEINRLKRKKFFAWIVALALAGREGGPNRLRVLDVGCAYGHLLELFGRLDCYCVGVEPIEILRNRQNAAGKRKIYSDVHELQASDVDFDVITMIDSLYYFEDPLECLRQLAGRLSPNGVMVIRVTNRTPLLNFHNRFNKRRISNSIFGDQLIAFSHRAMQICTQRAGMHIKSVHLTETKDISGSGFRGFLYYRVMPMVAAATGLKVTPGLTYTCVRVP